MTFFSILCALLIEQLKPLRADNQVYGAIKALTIRIDGTTGEEVGFFAGTLIAPALTAQTLLITRIAPNQYATEAFTWSATFIVSGIGIGMAAGGAIAELVDVKTTFLLGSVVLAGMSLAALFLHRRNVTAT